MSAVINAIFGMLLKLSLLALALVFAVGLLAAALLYLAWGGAAFLLTGRKPAVAVLFSRFRQLKKFSAAGVWPSAGVRPRADQPDQAVPPDRADVVDVEVREIRDDRRER